MSLSSCVECWMNPCVCGYEYERMSLQKLSEIREAVNRVYDKRIENTSVCATLFEDPLNDAIALIKDFSKQFETNESRYMSTFGCVDEGAPTELAKKAKEFLKKYKIS